jgi:N-acetylglutamate synthase-like GNAT family acetyltransferase
LLERAQSRGFEEVFALSIDERHWRFFESIGLMPCERETLPAAWQSRYDFTRPSRAFRIHFDAATQASRSN